MIVDLFDLPRRLHGDAERCSALGGALVFALLAAGRATCSGARALRGARGQRRGGRDRFLAAIVLADPEGLPGLAIAACIGQA